MTSLLRTSALLLIALPLQAADEFEFRGEERPVHDKTVTVDELREQRQRRDVVVLDVRLLEDFEADPVLIPEATYRDPELIEAWAGDIPKDSKVVVYCVRGKWVSHKAADYLTRHGLDAYTLEGGIEAWKQSSD